MLGVNFAKYIASQKVFFSVMLLACFMTPLAQGAVQLAVPAIDCACKPNENKDLVGPSQINFGYYLGYCVDSCHYRKSSTLSLRSGDLNHQKDRVVITNLKHQDSFWRAELPIYSVESAWIGFEEFMPGIFHVFLVFDFEQKSPVVLRNQEKSKTPISMKIKEVVVSPEGVPPREGRYNLFDAYLERYPLGIRAISKTELVNWSVKKLKHPVRLYPLQLSFHQKVELLKASLSVLDFESFREKYSLLKNNCATKVLDLIDAVVKPESQRHPFYYSWLYNLERALPVAGPIGTLNILLNRKLIADARGVSLGPNPSHGSL